MSRCFDVPMSFLGTTGHVGNGHTGIVHEHCPCPNVPLPYIACCPDIRFKDVCILVGPAFLDLHGTMRGFWFFSTLAFLEPTRVF